MDYCIEVTNAHISFTKEFNLILLEKMEIESDFIHSCLESASILLEEAQAATDTSKLQEVWQKIKAFFQRLLEIFTEKTKGMYEANKKWMDENLSKLDSVDFDKLKIEMIPFWNMTLDRVKNDSLTFTKKIESIVNNKKQLDKYGDLDTVKKNLFKEYLDENGDLTAGLKNYYRVGNAKGPIKPVALEGADLRNKAQEFKSYCINYNATIVPFIQSLMNSTEKEMQRIESALKNVVATESFCLIENAFYKDTEINYCENHIVMEAETPAPAPTNPPAQNTQQQTQKPAPAQQQQQPTKVTQVNVVNKANPNQVADDAANKKVGAMNSDQLTFMKTVLSIVQIDVSAIMTVFEERFRAYINALKGLLNEGGKNPSPTPVEPKPAEGTKVEPKK